MSASLTRFIAWLVPSFGVLFIIHNYFIFWQGWPGTLPLIHSFGGNEASLADANTALAWAQFLSWIVVALAVAAYAAKSKANPLQVDADRLSAIAAFIIRGCFWGIVLIGIFDIVISFLRVEELLEVVLGERVGKELGRPIFRGTYVHYPLLIFGFVIGSFSRRPSFIWLTLLVVLAEFSIVISRFVFSYEQAFQGDLVRFWYAGLFLFASAYALVTEGHVRVDVLYTNFSARGKALSNTCGIFLLGLPLCWVILTTGMWGKGSSLNSPLMSFEIYQQGFGMYVKYLMVGFLVIFAVSMLFQFCSYLLSNVAVLRGEASSGDEPQDSASAAATATASAGSSQ
jgi:TRAP-type mannitol/chloroaromatic compound transport system permease small subunit